jgi:hypothetical protein
MSNPAEEPDEVQAEFEDEDPDNLVGEPVEDDGMPAEED